MKLCQVWGQVVATGMCPPGRGQGITVLFHTATNSKVGNTGKPCSEGMNVVILFYRVELRAPVMC